MRKLLLLASFILACAPLAPAQTVSDDYNKVEVYGGYSHNRVDTGLSDATRTSATSSTSAKASTASRPRSRATCTSTLA